MTITQASLGNVPRDPTNFLPHPDKWSVGAFGELVYGGGTAFQCAANPTAEVVDGTGVSLGRDYRVTGLVSAGTLTVEEAGEYDVELVLADTSDQTGSGNVTWDIQYAPDGVTFAAFDATDAGGGGRMSAIRAAATAKKGLVISKVQHLNKASKVRVVVTSTAADVTTITEGRFRITKLADNNPVF